MGHGRARSQALGRQPGGGVLLGATQPTFPSYSGLPSPLCNLSRGACLLSWPMMLRGRNQAWRRGFFPNTHMQHAAETLFTWLRGRGITLKDSQALSQQVCSGSCWWKKFSWRLGGGWNLAHPLVFLFPIPSACLYSQDCPLLHHCKILPRHLRQMGSVMVMSKTSGIPLLLLWRLVMGRWTATGASRPTDLLPFQHWK